MESKIGVNAELYASLQRRFDNGERNVCTGRKDGTDRLLRRDPVTKELYDAKDGRHVISYDFQNKDGIPISTFGKFTKNTDGRFAWMYDDKGVFIGASGIRK